MAQSNGTGSVTMPLPSTLVIGGREVDGRTIPARRYKAVCLELASDVGGDPTTGQWLLIQRAAGLTVQCELLDQHIASGQAVDPDTYARLTGSLIRTLTTLGIRRSAREVPDDGRTLDGHARAVREFASDA